MMHLITPRSYVRNGLRAKLLCVFITLAVKPPILGPVLKLVFNVQFEDMVNAVA